MILNTFVFLLLCISIYLIFCVLIVRLFSLNSFNKYDFRFEKNFGYNTDLHNINVKYQILNYFEKHNIYKKCFFNCNFMNYIFPYLKSDNVFKNCTFEFNLSCIDDILIFLNKFSNNEFIKCKFYIVDYDKIYTIKELYKETGTCKIIDKFISLTMDNDCEVIKISYIEILSQKFNNNLKNVDIRLLYGLSYFNANLSKVEFPTDKNLFLYAYKKNFSFSKLPKLDFNNYKIDKDCIFYGTNFHRESVLAYEMFPLMQNCNIPFIDFSKIEYKKNKIKLNFCILSRGAIFPEDINFFHYVDFSNCVMPTYDYSIYNSDNNVFHGCKFSDESILPKDMLINENMDRLYDIGKIPKKYLESILLNSKLFLKPKFLEAYKDSISLLMKFIAYNIRKEIV